MAATRRRALYRLWAIGSWLWAIDYRIFLTLSGLTATGGSVGAFCPSPS